nr:MAG TPA: hypothetical protein [Caudoviricetes sp.]
MKGLSERAGHPADAGARRGRIGRREVRARKREKRIRLRFGAGRASSSRQTKKTP